MEFEENPLIPSIVTRIAGRQFSSPIIGESHALEVATNALDIRPGDIVGVSSHLSRCIFCWHSK